MKHRIIDYFKQKFHTRVYEKINPICMKKIYLLCSFVALCSVAYSQINGSTFGVVRKNYYSYVIDPIDTNFNYQQLDSASIRLGKIDHATGLVTSLGEEQMNEAVNLTGAALNPYDSTYIFMGASQMLVISLTTGEVLNRVTISNPIAESYFDNFRFNNSDSTLYGLARRYNAATSTGEVYLAKINTTTGVITQISPTSVAQGFALAGSAINPYEMVFYFSIGSNILGLDLYSGEVYSNTPIQNTDGIIFDNFTYSCSDTSLYGLVRRNYYTIEIDSISGFESQYFDSATVRLGKIDIATGNVSVISNASLLGGGYSLNAGATIDPSTDTYYFSNGDQLIGVDIHTGVIVSNPNFSFTDGMYFDLMRNFGDCRNAERMRQSPVITAIPSKQSTSTFEVFPNPANDLVQLKLSPENHFISITDLSGKSILRMNSNAVNSLQIPVSDWAKGLYIVSVDGAHHTKLMLN